MDQDRFACGQAFRPRACVGSRRLGRVPARHTVDVAVRALGIVVRSGEVSSKSPRSLELGHTDMKPGAPFS